VHHRRCGGWWRQFLRAARLINPIIKRIGDGRRQPSSNTMIERTVIGRSVYLPGRQRL